MAAFVKTYTRLSVLSVLKTCLCWQQKYLPFEVRSLIHTNMYEKSNVNSAAALREARRKRILENSANRLKLIEGINLRSSKASSESIGVPKPEIEARETNTTLRESSNSEINSKLNEIITSNNELKEISDFLLRDLSRAQGGEDLAEEGGVVLEEGVDPEEKSETLCFGLLLQKRLHYVILALSVNILLFFNVGYLFYENIFCPFYTLKTIELISRGREKEHFQPVLLLLSACLPKSVQKFTKIFFIISSALLPDLCIYLFTFIIGAKIMNMED